MNLAAISEELKDIREEMRASQPAARSLSVITAAFFGMGVLSALARTDSISIFEPTSGGEPAALSDVFIEQLSKFKDEEEFVEAITPSLRSLLGFDMAADAEDPFALVLLQQREE